MELDPSPKGRELQERLLSFMDEWVYRNEALYDEQLHVTGNERTQPPVMEEMKAEARRRGLWNLFLPGGEHGAGLTNVDYAPLAEIMGRTTIAPEATNCAAPDTGNMELLSLFGTDDQKRQWLQPLLDGEMRSAFAMTEPAVASSDARNIQSTIVRDGDEYVINGRKWWSSNILHPNCRLLIFMGKTDPEASTYRQQSMVLVPVDSPGLTIERDLHVFGYQHAKGHGQVLYEDVRVPVENLLGEEGSGFAMAQARLGPGRIHHCMRTLGAAERALELLCQRALDRTAFGGPIADQGVIRDWIAESRMELDQARLWVLKTAWLMDTVGNKEARVEIAGIKVAVPNVALKVIDRAIQVHGGAGVSQDTPLASMWAQVRTMRIADGPDEVHKRTVARHELAKHRHQDER